MAKRTVGFTGTVSQATMRPEDLIPAYMEVLEEYWPEQAAKLTAYYGGECGWPYATCGLLFPDPLPDHLKEVSGWLLQDLCDALGEIAPEDHYFGSTPGDGCDYGFWQNPFDDADSW